MRDSCRVWGPPASCSSWAEAPPGRPQVPSARSLVWLARQAALTGLRLTPAAREHDQVDQVLLRRGQGCPHMAAAKPYTLNPRP